jgi:predicted Zn-ribbon and HTH transcriptional regulator
MLLMKRKYMTVIDKVYTALVERGEELTAKQIAARFGTKKPRQVIYQLRSEGLDIGLNKSVDTKGRVKYKYSAG